MTELARLRRTRTGDPQNVPHAMDEPEMVTVETAWGEVQPMEPIPGIRTVGELEVAELVLNGAQLVDTRCAQWRTARGHARSGLPQRDDAPGSHQHPHDQVLARKGELDASRVQILFCNGPQCPQTPAALRALSEDGYPLDRLAYYRGGMHDWITLAMPTQQV